MGKSIGVVIPEEVDVRDINIEEGEFRVDHNAKDTREKYDRIVGEREIIE